MDMKAEERALEGRLEKIRKQIAHRTRRAEQLHAELDALRAELEEVGTRHMILVAKNSGAYLDDDNDEDA